MRELPRGTVTFLFTDIEGSTRLLHELGPGGYADALARHRGVLREAFERNGGVEVDTQGDAFFVAFPTAPGALEAAREAQEKLELAVRMGLHTGTPLVTAEGYVGVDVHRAARIAAVGHGRQVLVSAATATLVDPARLFDLGEHRLKDLSAPERIFQLGDGEFPPLKTLHRTNLPIPATPFLGREQELAEVQELLARDEVRLLTLTGPGGAGKTRLALQVAGELADSYPDGVWWVPLAPITDPADVAPAAARALGGGGSLPEVVGARRLLLLLDNFEHVVEAATEVAAVLAQCLRADVLVTSRERLRVQGEQVYPVPVLERAQARRLFVARARAAQPDFVPDEHVDELCARLDDLPLALELAAARTTLLSTEQILERVSRRLDLFKGGRDSEPRQATLRATIEWSHDLLAVAEQRLFRLLGVFVGGCTLEAAEAVCDADLDTVQSLVDKSLVRRTGDRLWMLEMIREYAVDQLEEAERDEIERRQAEFLLELAERANLLAEKDGAERMELVRPEHANFRAAIDWAIGHDVELAFRIATALEQFWVVDDPFEGVRLFEALLVHGDEVAPVLRARALRCIGEATWIAGDFEAGGRLMEQSTLEFEQLGDERAVAIGRQRVGVWVMRANDAGRARRLFEESLAMCRRIPNLKLEGDVLGCLGWVEMEAGNCERALELYEQSASICERAGFIWKQVDALREIARISLELGRTEVARERAQEALRLSRLLVDHEGILFSLGRLVEVEVAAGRIEHAGLLWGAIEVEEERAPVGHWQHFRGDVAALVEQGGEEVERGRRAGRRLTLEEAVEQALSIDSPA